MKSQHFFAVVKRKNAIFVGNKTHLIMKKYFFICCGAISTLMYLVGIGIIISSFVNQTENPLMAILYGVGIFSFGLILSGFSCIVEAACLYLEKNQKKEE